MDKVKDSYITESYSHRLGSLKIVSQVSKLFISAVACIHCLLNGAFKFLF